MFKSLLISALLLIPAVSVGNTVSINWAGIAVPGGNPPLALNNIIGAPDFNQASFDLNPASASLSSFITPTNYDISNFSTLLGITSLVLGNADVIVFEYNGSSGFQVENSTWTFTAGGVNEILNLDISGSDDSLVEGTISNINYSSFFGIPNLFGNVGEITYALFDLSVVDPLASDFEITIEGGTGVLGTPDLDSVGVISAVPIPGAALLFFSGLIGLFVPKFANKRS